MPQPGYWCECTMFTPVSEFGVRRVATLESHNPTQALSWVRVSLRTLMSVLTEQDAEEVLEWLTFGQCNALRTLRSCSPFVFSISCRETKVEWTIRSVKFLPLASHHGTGDAACRPDMMARRPAQTERTE
ncbi:hypothetical protein [Streptomyces hainanensis]|uniref:Uncharacterized protein n=1 Tax=Streptomyces hainanensis TaxID=402648 RepID=A0A4R4TGM6_9ACTN|nr:hypothetical protein [Streptomyces hainanensis]TDC74794.1 hypothetical protein E1283_14490 [Streptomyces hainanensis]